MLRIVPRITPQYAIASLCVVGLLTGCSDSVGTAEPPSDAERSLAKKAEPALALLDWRAEFPGAEQCDVMAPRVAAETNSTLELISTRELADVLQCTYQSESDARFVVEFHRLPSEGKLASGENIDLADDDDFVAHYEALGFEADTQVAETAGAAQALFRFQDEQSAAQFVGGANVVSFWVTGVGVTRTEFANLVASVASSDAAARGVLEVFEVVGLPVEAGSTPTKPGNRILTTPDGEHVEIGPIAVRGEQIYSVEAVEVMPNSWSVDVLLTSEGAQAWVDATEHACANNPEGFARLALIVGNQVLSAPSVRDCSMVELNDRIAISGFDEVDARAVVDSISQSG